MRRPRAVGSYNHPDVNGGTEDHLQSDLPLTGDSVQKVPSLSDLSDDSSPGKHNVNNN